MTKYLKSDTLQHKDLNILQIFMSHELFYKHKAIAAPESLKQDVGQWM